MFNKEFCAGNIADAIGVGVFVKAVFTLQKKNIYCV